MGDGVIAVDTEGHEDVGGGVGDDYLEEPDELAHEQPRLPGHGHLPHDVSGHGEQTNTEVGQGQMHDEKVHPRPSCSRRHLGDEDQGVAGDDDGEKEAQKDELLGLERLAMMLRYDA